MPALSDLAALTPQEHEALCRRCGMSCHFAIPVNGLAVVIDALRCKFLARDAAGKFLCSVYDQRFTLAPWCHTAESALSGGFLAQDCPYARGVPGYRGKVRLSSALLAKVLPAVRAEVARAGAPIGADPDAVAAFLGEAAGGPWHYAVSADGTRYLFTPASDGATPLPATMPQAPPASADPAAADPQQAPPTHAESAAGPQHALPTHAEPVAADRPSAARRSAKLRIL